jgi:hypothetical protein
MPDIALVATTDSLVHSLRLGSGLAQSPAALSQEHLPLPRNPIGSDLPRAAYKSYRFTLDTPACATTASAANATSLDNTTGAYAKHRPLGPNDGQSCLVVPVLKGDPHNFFATPCDSGPCMRPSWTIVPVDKGPPGIMLCLITSHRFYGAPRVCSEPCWIRTQERNPPNPRQIHESVDIHDMPNFTFTFHIALIAR